jgi:hypothetical protein
MTHSSIEIHNVDRLYPQQINGKTNEVWPVPIVQRSEARTVFGRSRGLESHSRHGCVSAFFCVVLSCVCR